MSYGEQFVEYAHIRHNAVHVYVVLWGNQAFCYVFEHEKTLPHCERLVYQERHYGVHALTVSDIRVEYCKCL